MTLEGAANFLVGSILFGLGSLIIGVVVIMLNNLFSKYWKPYNWGSMYSEPLVFNPNEPPKVEPVMSTKEEEKKDPITK